MDISVTKQLLFGLLAYQNGWILRDQLLSAFQSWIADPSVDLDSRIANLVAIPESDQQILHRLIELHSRRFTVLDPQNLSVLIADQSLVDELRAIAQAQPRPNEDLLKTLSVQSDPRHNPTASSDRSPQRAWPVDYSDNRFRILRPHAQGGLGIVYVGEDNALRREVAIKQIRSDRPESTENRTKFLREAEVTGRLEHPGIIPVYALGTDRDGKPFYVMRLVRGLDLRSEIQNFYASRSRSKSSLDGPELRSLLRRFLDICNAIEYAHFRGVLHRDLKPGNIMLGKHGETLVVDWGLAKVVDRLTTPKGTDETHDEFDHLTTDSWSDSNTAYGSIVGTPAYSPPEQLRGQIEKLGPASDTYSLGAILYEILTGRPPHSGSKLEEVLDEISNRRIISPSVLNPYAPKPLSAVCLKALSPEISDRFPSASELKNEVERFLNNEAVKSYSEPLSEYWIRIARKNPTLVASMVGAALILLVGTTGFSLISQMYSRELAQRQSLIESKSFEIQQRNTELELANEEVTKRIREVKQTNARRFLASGARAFDEGARKLGSQDLLFAFELSKSDPGLHRSVSRICLDRFTQSHLTPLPSEIHPDLTFLGYSPDGLTYFAANRGERSLHVFDLITGRPIRHHKGDYHGLVGGAVSPDGTRLLTVHKRYLKLWSTETLLPLGEEVPIDITKTYSSTTPQLVFNQDWSRALVVRDSWLNHDTNTPKYQVTLVDLSRSSTIPLELPETLQSPSWWDGDIPGLFFPRGEDQLLVIHESKLIFWIHPRANSSGVWRFLSLSPIRIRHPLLFLL
jgi:serine/threonine protein kinase